MIQRWRHRDTEQGFTVVELVIASFMLLMITGSTLSIMESMFKHSGYQEARVVNQEQVRFAIQAAGRDLRGSDPFILLSSPGAYATEFEGYIYNDQSNSREYARWWLNGTTLERSVITGPGGTIVSTRDVLTNVRNTALGTQLFRYYSDGDVELKTSGAGVSTAGDIQNCTVRVRISVTSDPDPGPTPFTESIDVELRNRLPGGTGC